MTPRVVDYERALRGLAPLDIPVDGVATTDLDAAREHWRIHMVAEFASSRVFAALVPQIMAAGLDPALAGDVIVMAGQEVEHGLLSARVHAALGGEPRSALFPLDPVPVHDDVEPLEAVLRNVIAISCSGETLAVAVIGAERERATAPELREVLSRILADEVGHARFGWRLLGEVAPGLDVATKKRLAAYLVAIFERDIGAMRGAIGAPPANDDALALGAPDGPTMWATFWETMTEVTVPTLEALGIRAQWAWDKAIARTVRQSVAGSTSLTNGLSVSSSSGSMSTMAPSFASPAFVAR